MADIRTVWNGETQTGDWQIVGGALDASGDLETAVLLSLFTWARAAEDDPLPYEGADRKGWWGNLDGEALHGIREIGSKLWLLARRLQNEETRQDAIRYAADALNWMKDSAVVARIDVDAQWVRPGMLGLVIKLYAADGSIAFDRRYAWAWNQIEVAA